MADRGAMRERGQGSRLKTCLLPCTGKQPPSGMPFPGCPGPGGGAHGRGRWLLLHWPTPSGPYALARSPRLHKEPLWLRTYSTTNALKQAPESPLLRVSQRSVTRNAGPALPLDMLRPRPNGGLDPNTVYATVNSGGLWVGNRCKFKYG